MEGPGRELLCRIDNQISTWLSQEALVREAHTLGWRSSQASFFSVNIEVDENDVNLLTRLGRRQFSSMKSRSSTRRRCR